MSKKRSGRPDFDALTEAQLLAGRTAVRCIHMKPTDGQDLGELLTVIEHVIEAATGERSFLHLRPDSRPVQIPIKRLN